MAELDTMGDAEFFARQTWHAESKIARGARMTGYEIVDESQIGENEVRFLIRRSGAPGDPRYTEEIQTTLIKMPYGWRVKH